MMLPTEQTNRQYWLPGPWNEESDNEDFVVGETNCFLRRTPNGSWQGFVELEKPLTKAKLNKVSAYGGVQMVTVGTISYLSFTCDSDGDLVPGMMLFRRESINDGVYRDVAFAKEECARIVAQL